VVSGSLHGEGGLTTGSTRPLDSLAFKVECCDDGRMLAARGGLSGALCAYLPCTQQIAKVLILRGCYERTIHY
jgi:hypothetical protein